MLLGIIFYLSSLVFGALLADYFFSKYVSQRLILFAMGVPIGFALAAYCTLFFEILFESFHWWLVALASLLMLAISFYLCLHLRWRRKGLAEFRKELRDHRLLYCGILLISLVLMLMQYQGLRATAGGVSAADNYGVDFLFHLGIGNSLIYGPFPPQFPYAAGAANVYPFIPDFYSALLVYSGLGLVMPFYLMNFLLYFSLVAIGSYLFFRLSKSQWLPLFAMFIFIFCGEGLSLIVMGVFNVPLYASQTPTSSLLYSNYSSLFFLITFPYFNFEMPVINNFAPQHEYLLAFPYALVLITIAYLVLVEESRRIADRRTYLFLGLLLGLTPLIHPPTFIFLLVFGFVMVLYLVRTMKGAKRKSVLKLLAELGLVGLAVSLVEILYMHSQSLGGSVVSSAITVPVWYSAGAGIVTLILLHGVFWLEVFGSIFVIGIAGMFLLNKKQLLLFVPPFILFVIINFIWFPPGFGDSNKYTVYLIFFLGFSSAAALRWLFKGRSIPFKVLAAVLFISIVFSGLIAEANSDANAVYSVANNLSLRASSWLVNNTNPDSLFVTNCYQGTYDYLPTIAGRSTLLDIQTYTQPVGIYKYNMGNLTSGINEYMENANCRFVDEYGVNYVVVDNLSYLRQGGPLSCTAVNYTALASSPNLTMVDYFLNASSGENIMIFRTLCGS